MIFKRPRMSMFESMFDVSQPTMYMILLPVMLLAALGLRSQAVMFTLGALTFIMFLGVD